MRRRSILAVPAMVAAFVACSSDRAAPTAVGSTTTIGVVASPLEVESVGMIGDSITVGAEPALRETIGGLGLDLVALDAANGRRIAVEGTVGSGVEAVERLAADDPDLWVVALGTNDVLNLTGPEEYAEAIDELLVEIPAEDPVVWVDIYFDEAEEASVMFNDVLRERLAERGGATAVDWASVAPDEGVLRDGVHPTGYGNVLFAERVADGVAAWLA